MAGKIFKFLPKAASFSIPNPNPNNSSSKNYKSKYVFSGPIHPMIPDHRRRHKTLEEEEEEEPTSPKVSCIGQVNHKKKKSSSKKKKTTTAATKKALLEEQQKKKKKKEAPKRTSSIGGMFWRKAKPAARRDDVAGDSSDGDGEGVGAAAAAGIGRMRRYASGRVEALKDFDWRTIAQEDDDDMGDGKEEGHLVAHSGPILVGGGKVASEPKKEANIWTRRSTRTPPVPLRVD